MNQVASIGNGDVVYLRDNPLIDKSLDVYDPQCKKRRVEIN